MQRKAFFGVPAVIGLALALGAGAGSGPLFSQWPAPPADAIVPDANQQITLLTPLSGQQYRSVDHLHAAYRTGDGVSAELYVDGRRVPNDSEIALCRYALGTHKVRVNPLMHPEKAQEVSFQIVPVATLKDTPDTIEIALDMDPFSAAHLDTGSLKLISVNGQTLAADQVVPASQPLRPACASTTSPWLRCMKVSFSKQKLQTKSKTLSVKSASVQGYVTNPRAASGGTDFNTSTTAAPQQSQSSIPDKFAFERVWGQQGSPGPQPNQPLAQPLGIAGNPPNPYVNKLYVIDAGNHRVKEYDTNGNFIQSWGHAGLSPGGFDMPVGIAISPDGNTVYVTDSSRQKVLKFATSDGSFLGEWGDMTVFNGPKGIAVDASGNVYVVDSGNGRVLKFDPSGAPLATIGSPGTGNGQFSSPYAITIAATGEFYVTDILNNTVQKFDAGGNFLLGWGATGTDPGQFRSPRGVAVTQDNATVMVVDSDNARLQAFDNGGNFVSQAGSFGSAPGQFNSPEGIVIDTFNQFFVSDTGNQRVQWFNYAGQFQIQFGPIPVPPDPNTAGGYFQNPVRIAQDGQGHLYVADQNNHRIQKFDTQGNFLLGFGGRGITDGRLQAPTDVAVSPDGSTVYVNDSGNGRIQAFDPNGNFLRKWSVASINSGLAVDAQGFVYVMAGSLIQKYQADGTFVRTIGSYGSNPGQFRYLFDVAVDRTENKLYTLDLDNGVQIFDLDGNFLGIFLSNGSFRGIAADGQGGIYLTSTGGFVKYGTDKTPIKSWFKFSDASQPDGFDESYGIAVDPDLKIYVTDLSLNRVSKFQQGFALPPTAVPGPDHAVLAYLPATLDGSASHDNGLGTLVSWAWHFSDGTPDQSGAIVQHRFYKTGVFTATLTVTDDDGMTDSASAQITVAAGPGAAISFAPLQPTAGQPVGFDGTASSDVGGTITGYAWTFGDGGSASGPAPTHAFPTQGSYLVTLTVTDANNLTGSASVAVQVASNIPGLLQNLDQLAMMTDPASPEHKLLVDLKTALQDPANSNPSKAIPIIDKFITDVQALQTAGKISATLASRMVQAAQALRSAFSAEADTILAGPAGPSSQVGTAGRLLEEPLAVLLTDTSAIPVANIPVRFRISQGKGLLVRDWSLSTVTDATGRAGMRFLCPADLQDAAGGSGAALAVVDAVRTVRDPDTGDLTDRILVSFSIEMRAPDFRAASSNRTEDVPQENSGTQPYSVQMKDAQGRLYEGQDIEYRFTDANGVPLLGDHGTLLPASQVTDPMGLAQAAYVSQLSTPMGTFNIQARPLPPLKDETGKDIAILFPPITVVAEDSDYASLKILGGNGQVVLPWTKSEQELLTQYLPSIPTGNATELTTSDVNTLEASTGVDVFHGQVLDLFDIVVRQDSQQRAGVKITTAAQRAPQFIEADVSGVPHGIATMAVGEPECYLVERSRNSFVPARNVLAASLDDLGHARQYFVEAKLPPFNSYAPPAISGGVTGLDVGKDTELPARDEFVAPTRLDLAFTRISQNDRYSLWRTSTPIKVLKDAVFSATKPALPAGAVYVQAVALGGVQPFVTLVGSVYPGGMLRGIRKHVLRFEVVDKYDVNIPFGTAASDPHPTIRLDALSPGDVKIQGGLALFTLKGSVYDPIADVVENHAADITQVMVGDDPVPVTRAPDDRPADPVRRPFPFKGRFERRIVTPITNDDTTASVHALNAIGNAGGASALLRTKMQFDEANLPTAVSANAVYLGDQPLVFSLPPGFSASAPDTIHAGLGLDGALSPVTETGKNSLDFVGAIPNLGHVEIAFSGTPLLQSGVRNTVTATATVPTLNLDHAALAFIETAPGSRLFALTAKRLHLTLGALSPSTVDAILLAVDTDTASGTPVSLTETGPTTRVFTGTHPDLGNVSIDLGLYFGPNDAVQENILASVSAQTPFLTGASISFRETTAASNEFIENDTGFALGGTALAMPGGVAVTAALQDVLKPHGTDEGLVNGLVIHYLDLDKDEASTSPVRVQRQSFNLIRDPHGLGFVADRPLLGVARPVSKGFRNVFDVKDPADDSFKIEKDDLTLTVDNVVAGDSPTDVTRVPRGVKNRVALVSGSLGFPTFTEPITIQAVWRGGGPRDIDGGVTVDQGSIQRKGRRVILVDLTVAKNHPKEPFSLQVVSGKDTYELWDIYEAVDMRVVIVALDGGSYPALLKGMREYNGALASLFTQRGADGREEVRHVIDPEAALNSLPTLTFTNWATWVTGKAPKDHGILGNSFFPRDFVGDAEKGVPFACANRQGIYTTISGVHALGGSLDSKDNMRASEFGRLTELFKPGTDTIYTGRDYAIFNSQYGAPVAGTSNHWHHFIDPFFPISTAQVKKQLTLTEGGGITFLHPDALEAPKLADHNAENAKRLDSLTADDASDYWSVRDAFSMARLQFMYFPGPDNAAHSEEGPNGKKVDFGPGHSLENLIGRHIGAVTDVQFAKVLKVIDDGGWRSATMFVVIADHGLIDTPRWIHVEDGVMKKTAATDKVNPLLAKVIAPEQPVLLSNGAQVQMNLWRGGSIDVNARNIVYASDGGMAHVYLQGFTATSNGTITGQRWSLPPGADFVRALAGRLYQENQTGASYPLFRGALADLNVNGAVSLFLKPSGQFNEAYELFTGTSNVTLDGQGVLTAMSGLTWRDVPHRIQEEMNDKNPAGSRSGDIVLIMNTAGGVISVNNSKGDDLPGWHGAPTKAESEVPMIFSIPGVSRQDLFDVIEQAINDAKTGDSEGKLRSLHFRQILGAIQAKVGGS